MQRLCFMMTLTPGREAEYERRHDKIWPEMMEALHRVGFRNYSLFRRDLHVIGYAECEPDVATVLDAMAAEPVNARWGASFGDIIATRADESGNLIDFTELWHLS